MAIQTDLISICRQQEERERQAQLRGAPTMDPDIAATKIQKVRLGWVYANGKAKCKKGT